MRYAPLRNRGSVSNGSRPEPTLCYFDSQRRVTGVPEFGRKLGALFALQYMTSDWEKLEALALAEVEGTLAALPAPLREKVQKLPITFERRPNRALQADGIAADTLGLFVGPEFAEEDAVPMPPQIILFLDNLWEQAEADEEFFRDEVHTSVLHELGHYLGLDEDDLTERGLE